MGGYDLIKQLEDLTEKLNKAQKAFKDNGEAYANAERLHDISFAKALLEEKENGVQATIIEKVVKGRDDIAELKFKLNVAETLFKAADKAIDSYKLQMRMINDQIQREWGKHE